MSEISPQGDIKPPGGLPEGVRFETGAPFGAAGKVVRRYKLDNGLTVLLLEDHAAPIFSFQIWYRVGSAHEEVKKTGLAHLFEHLMFKGTERHPAGVFDREMERRGAQTNAGTWLDWTFYYENLPSGPNRGPENLARVADFEADRMTGLVLEPEPFASELEVVKNERRLRVDNDPDGRIDEALWELAFDRHSYRWPTIGWMEDLEGMELEDARDFYRAHYAPNQAVVAVVGDVDEVGVLEAICESFGSIPPSEPREVPRETEPEQREERRRTLRLPLATERLLIGYHVPGLTHPDHVPLQLLSEILFNSESARMERALVQDSEVALDAHGWCGPFADPCLFEMAVTCQRGRTAEEALSRLDAVADEVRRDGVSEAELERARNKIKMGMLRGMLPAHHRAYRLAFYEVTAGDFRKLFEAMEAVDRATTGDVARVAQRWLRKENRTIVTGLPEEGGEGASGSTGDATPGPAQRRPALPQSPDEPTGGAPSPPGDDHVAGGNEDMAFLGAEPFSAGPVSGLVIEDRDLPYVAFAVDLYAGAHSDPEGKEGLARMAGEMRVRGTEAFTREQLAEALDGLGSALNVSVRRRVTSIRGDVAREHLDRFCEILSEVLWRPTFPEEEVQKLKRQTLSELEAIRDDDGALARRALARTLFKGHPWGRPLMGDETSVAAIERDDLVAWHEANTTTASMIVSASGAVSAGELREALLRAFPDELPTHELDASSDPEVEPPEGRVVVLVDKPERTQTQVLLGHMAPSVSHPDQLPLVVGNTAFGGTFTARLMQEVRVKRGWSYGAYSRVSSGKELGAFQVSFYPKTEDTAPALELVLSMLEDLKDKGLDPAEVDFARQHRTQAFPFQLETHGRRLSLLLDARFLGRPKDWVRSYEERVSAVTSEQVASALQRCVHPDNMVIAVTCTAADVMESIRALPGVSKVLLQAYDGPWDPQPVS